VIEYDPDIYDQGELLVKALQGCENPKLNELERYLFGVGRPWGVGLRWTVILRPVV
jgi:hypothetical protein